MDQDRPLIQSAAGKDRSRATVSLIPTLRPRRLAEALDPSAIDALLADAKAAGTPIAVVDGLLIQMTKAVLERALQAEMTHHLGATTRPALGLAIPVMVARRKRCRPRTGRSRSACPVTGTASTSRGSCQNAPVAQFAEFETEWGDRYPAIIRLWHSSWGQFTPFLAFPPEIQKIIYTTNAVESLNSRLRQATRRRGRLPNKQAALKVLYLVIRSPIANRTNVTGRTTGWTAALNALALSVLRRRITLNRNAITAHTRTIFRTDPTEVGDAEQEGRRLSERGSG